MPNLRTTPKIWRFSFCGLREEGVQLYLHDDLAVVNQQMQRVVEPGTFTVLVGAASDDIRQKGTTTIDI